MPDTESKTASLSQEELLQVIREAAVRAASPGGWVTWQEVQKDLPAEEGLWERIQHMGNIGLLHITYQWQNVSPTGVVGVYPAVGYCKDSPIIRVLS